MNHAQSIAVAGGAAMPSVGLGLWKIANERTADMVQAAIAAGYRHIDAACDYGNEREAGQGIARALQSGLCQRDELWITSKLWNTYHRPEHVRPAIEKSLSDLGLDSLDLYLIHFPISTQFVPFEERYPPGWFYDPDATPPVMLPTAVPIAETWGAMEELQRAGLCQHIGISNFGVSLIRDLLSYAAIRPAVLQIEAHPYLAQHQLLRYCLAEGVGCYRILSVGSWFLCSLGHGRGERFCIGAPQVAGIGR